MRDYASGKPTLVPVTRADLRTKRLVSVTKRCSQLRTADGDNCGAKERVESGPLGSQRFVFALELAADDADGVGGDAAVEAAGARHVRHDLRIEKVFDGGEQLIIGGSILHYARSIKFSSSHSVSAVRRPMVANSTDFDVPSR